MKFGSGMTRVCIAALSCAFFITGCRVDVRIDKGNDAVAEETGPASLKEAVASDKGLGSSAIVGACINSVNVHDKSFMEIVTANLNAVTLENELKPDAMFGYNNEVCPMAGMHEEEVGGKRIEVPALDHSRADAILDEIAAYNTGHPEAPIKVRGHVLVWHSQTPEWFFHEDYDASKDYVTKEEMDRRQEWYIRSMLDYYTGDDSKYKGMFYGWDVVNEAISDRTGTYRDETETSWWKVYGSNEYIINAFRYANKYAPADLKLYYNDYNECDSMKKKGILSLIADVKAADGTRIDGFGMQGHYSCNSPTADKIAEAAVEYADAAGTCMLTELDVKNSMFYKGKSEQLPEEYERQAEYYGSIYDALRKLYADGVNVTGITFWGICDKYTWLEGHHPLLFDEGYNAKPAYYAFTDGDR